MYGEQCDLTTKSSTNYITSNLELEREIFDGCCRKIHDSLLQELQGISDKQDALNKKFVAMFPSQSVRSGQADGKASRHSGGKKKTVVMLGEDGDSEIASGFEVASGLGKTCLDATSTAYRNHFPTETHVNASLLQEQDVGEDGDQEYRQYVHRFHPDSRAGRQRHFHKRMVEQVQTQKSVAAQALVHLESISHFHKSLRPPKNCKALVRSAAFNRACTLFTLVFAVVVGMEADLEMRSFLNDEAVPDWVLQATLLCNILYIAEIAIRVFAEGMVYFLGPDWKWNIFDLVLISFSIFDMIGIGITLSFLRIARATKIVKAFRVIRVLKLVGELRLLLISLIKSMAALMWSLLFLVMITYLASICFTQGAAVYIQEHDVDPAVRREIAFYYPDVPGAMYTLIACITGGQDWRLAAWPLWSVGSVYGIAFLLFVVITIMGLMNVITAVFVEHASNIVDIDREFAIMQHLKQVEDDVHEALHLFSLLDIENKGFVSMERLKDFCMEPHVVAYFSTLDMDVSEPEHLASLFDADFSGEVTKEEFLLGCIALRGLSKKSELRYVSFSEAMHLEHIEKQLSSLRRAIKNLRPQG